MDISLNRGDTVVYNLTLTKIDGTPEDLTGSTLWFMAKQSLGDADDLALISKSIGNGIAIVSAPAGTATLTFSRGDTWRVPLVGPDLRGNFYGPTLFWGLVLRKSDGSENTVLQGNLYVEAGVIDTVPFVVEIDPGFGEVVLEGVATA